MLIRLTPPTCECDIVDYCIIISTAVVFHRRTGFPAHCVYDARIVMSFRMSGYYDRFVFALRTFLCCRSSLWSLAASTPGLGDMVCVSVTQRKSMEITLLRKSVHKVIASILLSAVLDKNQKMQRKTFDHFRKPGQPPNRARGVIVLCTFTWSLGVHGIIIIWFKFTLLPNVNF